MWLLDHGAEVNAQAADQSTPLDVAGILCNPNRHAEGLAEMTRLFLARGADPVEPDAESWARPLAWAEKKGHYAIAAILAGRK